MDALKLFEVGEFFLIYEPENVVVFGVCSQDGAVTQARRLGYFRGGPNGRFYSEEIKPREHFPSDRAGKLAQEALSQHHAEMDARAEAYFTARALNPASAEQMYSGFDADFRRHLEGLAVAAYERSHPAM